MSHYRDWSIRTKLTLIALLACSVAVALACVALFAYEVQSFKRTLVADLQTEAATLAGLSTAALMFDDAGSATELLGELKNKPHIRWAVIYKEGRAFAYYLHPDLGGVLPDAPKARFEGEFSASGVRLSADIRAKGERVGRIYLAADLSRLSTRLWEYGQLLGLVFVTALLGALVMAMRLQRAITVPVQRLAAAARQVEEKQDYSVRVTQRGADELGRMTEAFNAMLARIEQQNAALRASQQRFEAAVTGSSDGLWDFDFGSQAVFYSPRWKEMLGYSDDELRNEPDTFTTLLHPDDRAEVLGHIDAYLGRRSSAYEAVFRLRHKDGAYRWILSRGAALRDERGAPIRFAGSHTDITERKRVEEEVRSSRAKFEALVNSINGIVWEADVRKSQVLYVNAQVEAVLGHPVERWVAQADFWRGFVHPDEQVEVKRAVRRGVALGQPFQLQHRAIRADGREVWLSESVSVEKRPDGAVILRGVAIDITEQRRAASELERMQRELVNASRLAGMAEVATGVLHNVGNVLNSVNIASSVVTDRLKKSRSASLVRAAQLLRAHEADAAEFLAHDPKGRQLPAFLIAVSDDLVREQEGMLAELAGLQKNVEHIKTIVATQQSFAKVAGALEPLSLAEVAEDALRIIASAFQRHRIELVRLFVPVPAVQADRHKVLQIVVNLLNNAKQALDARAEGRQLIVRVARGAPGRVVLTVADNGPGIAPENLAKIFNHGFTTKKTGHGFGLHSGANAAREMGGSLTVQSAGLGHGATFQLDLPISEAAGAPAKKAA